MRKALYMLIGWTVSLTGVFLIPFIIGIAMVAAGGALIDAADEL